MSFRVIVCTVEVMRSVFELEPFSNELILSTIEIVFATVQIKKACKINNCMLMHVIFKVLLSLIELMILLIQLMLADYSFRESNAII
jgi:hypothetical protein